MATIRTAPVRLLLAAVIAVLLSLWIGSQHPANAANFIVDSPADAVDAHPGDGICDDGAGNCTLRAAIQETNALPGADTITLPAGTYTLSIPGADEDAAATGDLDITDDLTLTGADRDTTIIDGGAIDRVIDSALDGQSITVTISDVSIENGRTSFSGGAGISNGRFGLGLLELRSVFVRNNIVAGPGGSGGGIHNIGVVTLEDVIVHNNDGFVSGGGIFNQGTLTISASTVRDNVTNSTGGGINSGGTATITNSAVSGNVAGYGAGGGGGIHNFGTMEISNSTVNDNSSHDWGGGVANGGELALTNTTLSGNAAGTEGGGIRNHPLGTSTLTNVTISDNTAATGGGIFSLADPFDFGGSVALKNSLLAHNTPFNCSGGGPIISHGHNLDSGSTCNFAGPGDLSSTDPLLGSLADNGGPTLTHALLSGSPAIDAGDSDSCPTTDQRGVVRPIDGDENGTATCDIGAYEYEPPTVTPTPTPTPTSGATPTATPAVLGQAQAGASELPRGGAEPASGGGGQWLSIALFAAAALALAGAGGILVGLRRRS
jgi:hypothetical protein